MLACPLPRQPFAEAAVRAQPPRTMWVKYNPLLGCGGGQQSQPQSQQVPLFTLTGLAASLYHGKKIHSSLCPKIRHFWAGWRL